MQQRPLSGRGQPLQCDKGKSIYIRYQQREPAAFLVYFDGVVLSEFDDMRVGTLRWAITST